MKKSVLVLFITLFIGMVAYSQNKYDETVFGIKIGSDYESVDNVLRGKGFSLLKQTSINSDVTQFGYYGGIFADTKPIILMTISNKNGLTSCNVSWNWTYYIDIGEAANDETMMYYVNNSDVENMQKRLCIKNKQKFLTLINSLNKKYGCKIELPDQFEKFTYCLYGDDKITVGYMFDGGESLGDCSYMLSFISKQWEGYVSDDL